MAISRKLRQPPPTLTSPARGEGINKCVDAVARSAIEGSASAARALPRSDLPERYRVHQTAAAPQIVQSAFELHRRALADIALEAFAVIADLLDDVIGKLVVETEPL